MDSFSRIKNLPPYIFNVTSQLKAKYIDEGIDVVDFSMGNPDQPTPAKIIEAMTSKLQNPSAHRYTESQGIKPLRQSMSNWLADRFKLDLCPDNEIIVTLGSKEGLAHVSMAMMQDGDVAIVPQPCYPIHKYAFVLAGAKVMPIDALSPEDLLKNLKELLKTVKPKVLILNFPTNPTTACVEIDFFEEIIQLAKKYQFWVIHDFAYADLGFNGYQPPSILQVKGAKDIAIETYSMSKSFNMPGWRIGFVYGNKKLIDALKRIKSYYDYGTYGPIQYAAKYALDNSKEFVPQILDKYKSRRDILCDGLNNIGWKVDKPDATMFVWAKIPNQFASMRSLGFSKLMLEHAHVSVTPGMAFGALGDGFVRLSLIEDDDRVANALKRIDTFLQKDITLEEK